MRHRILKIICVILASLLLCGCSLTDYTEPEDTLIVTALGVDKNNGLTLITCETADTANSDTVRSGTVFSANGKDLSAAFSQLDSLSYKELLFSKCPVILVGETVLGEPLKEVFDFFFENYDISFAVEFLCTKNAGELLNKERQSEIPIGFEISNLLKKTDKKGSSFAEITDIKNSRNPKFSLSQIAFDNSVLKILPPVSYKDFLISYEE